MKRKLNSMALQIALVWSVEGEVELVSLGFKKREVYIKETPAFKTEEAITYGDAEFFAMKAIPFQFVTTSYWGRGVD